MCQSLDLFKVYRKLSIFICCLATISQLEDAHFDQSHLKRKQDYGLQAVAVMLSFVTSDIPL